MKQTTGFSCLLLALASLFFGCKKDEAFVPEPAAVQFPNVDSRLWAYWQRFEAEAAARGVDADLAGAGILGGIEELSEEHVAGQCTYGSAIDEHIVIDKTFWNTTQSQFIREMVVFHELGHCFLHRDHREDAFPNGACRSIMRSGNGACLDNYNASTRASYLDELFQNQ